MKLTDKDRNKIQMRRKESVTRKNRSVSFPNCIGKFPECVNYTDDMSEEERVECKFCPHRKKRFVP